jgi:UDP-N-acetylmuramate dehydrogenase
MISLPSIPGLRTAFDLTPYNTFGLPAKCQGYVMVQSLDDLQEACRGLRPEGPPVLVLGGGSNILFVGDFDGIVIHNRIGGIRQLSETDDQVLLEVGGGENWHGFVRHCVLNRWGGVENLALIPGTVGAAPIQNIGAYGAELSQVFHSLVAVDIGSGKLRDMVADECQFGYRDSVFKRALKGKTVIALVRFRLSKAPVLNTSYGDIAPRLAALKPPPYTPEDVANVVEAIRREKLPDPLQLGNAGSFFKNPIISSAQFSELRKAHPGIPSYPATEGFVKVPAAWLIEQCGWKGKRVGNVGCHENQPLVIVNYGAASGAEVAQFAESIRVDVQARFNVRLEPEVNWVGTAVPA